MHRNLHNYNGNRMLEDGLHAAEIYFIITLRSSCKVPDIFVGF